MKFLNAFQSDIKYKLVNFQMNPTIGANFPAFVHELLDSPAYVVRTHCNCLYEAITICTYNICYSKSGKLFGNLHLSSIMSIVFAFFKHPKLPISIKIRVALLQIVYICMAAISPNSSL